MQTFNIKLKELPMKDFTRKQAVRWVQQQFATVTVANAAARLQTELDAVAFCDKYDMGDIIPNSRTAHQMLAIQIKTAFAV